MTRNAERDSTAAGRHEGVWDRMMRSTRRILMLVLMLAIAFLGLWWYARYRVDEEIRAYFENRLEEHYAPQGISASVGWARLIEGQAIEIHDIVLRDRASADVEPLARIDEVLVTCKAHMQDLIAGTPTPSHVAIRRMALRARRGDDGQWNVRRLLPPPKFGDCPPPISIENGQARIDLSGDGEPTKELRLRDLHLALSPDREKFSSGRQSDCTPMTFRGTVSSEHFELARVEGTLEPRTGSVSTKGDLSRLQVSAALIRLLPDSITRHLALAASLRGEMGLDFQFAYEPDEKNPIAFSVAGSLEHGQVDDPRLPYPLSEIAGRIVCSNDGLHVEELTARSGLGSIALSLRLGGFQPDSSCTIEAHAKNLVLDGQLASVLPKEVRPLWSKFDPDGTIDVDGTLTHTGEKWVPDLSIRCVEVAFAHQDYPYRVRGCKGMIQLTEDECALELQALVSGTVARITGQINNPGPDFTGHIDLSLDEEVTLNEEIISALKPHPQSVVRSLRPRGTITLEGRFSRSDPQHSLDSYLKIGVSDCTIKYDRFPYPIEQIKGVLELTNGQWEFRNLKGHNDSGYIVGEGGIRRQADGKSQLDLRFIGTSIALEDELRAALTPGAQSIWTGLRPRGTIDYLKVVVSHTTGMERPSIDVFVEKELKDDQQDTEGRSITVRPVWFPYQLNNVTGSFHYRDGQVALNNIVGEHGRTRLTLNGSAASSQAGWTVSLNRITASHLRPDHDLISALPAPVSNAIEQLQLRGQITMQGALGLARGSDPREPVRASWNLLFGMTEGQLHCGVPVEHIHGGIQLSGRFDEYGMVSSGQLDVDSLMYKDIQLTKVRGPILIRGDRITAGRWAHVPEHGGQPTPLTANLFGGTMAGEAQISRDSVSQFNLKTTLRDADLTQLARQFAPSLVGKITGKAYTEVELSGNKQGTHTLRGKGKVRLYDADIYEVPVMLAMLKLINFRSPDTTAFTTSDIDFRIHGSNVYFDRLDFSGDAISLRGNGEMDFNRQINLNFYTIVGRSEFLVPIVSPILGLASRQFLRIHVDGTLDEPNEPQRQVLPGINETLQQLFPEYRESSSMELLKPPTRWPVIGTSVPDWLRSKPASAEQFQR